MNFSAQTSSERTQTTIDQKLEKKSKGTYSAPGNKKLVIFIDDVNMPAMEKYGAQPPIELLRQLVDAGGYFDRNKFNWKSIKNCYLICCAAPPGGGRSALTPRFMRHFFMLCLPQPNEKVLAKIFGSIVSGFFQEFPGDIQRAIDSVVKSVTDMYSEISIKLRPTPSKFHYTFNLRDVSKVFQGILMTHPIAVGTVNQLARLWIHETCRVFGDRLNSVKDLEWFYNFICELLQRCYRLTWNKEELFDKDTVLFSNVLNLERPNAYYEEIQDKNKLQKFLYAQQEEFNTERSDKLNLVFFSDAIRHTLRICRVLYSKRGNLLLIGVGGSGKQSLSKLAAFILKQQIFQIELTKSYGTEHFRDDLKKMMQITGVQGKALSFILADTQVVNEGFLEDVNGILNTGEVTGLYSQEEADSIINDVRNVAVQMKLPDTRDVISQLFIQRVRDNLHIILCMSPVGDALRLRCRKFPSIVNCCTLDWFFKWPESALIEVSKSFLANVKENTEALVQSCMEIYVSVEKECENFFNQYRRKVYTTPKSYLDMINLFLKLYQQKIKELQADKDQLVQGLKKLKETKISVNQLQEQLTKWRPELDIQAAKTEQYLEQVTRETEAADKIKNVVEEETMQVNMTALECKAKADEAKADLEQAMPALRAATEALNALDKKDITVMKAFTSPPAAVVMVMDAVCTLLGVKPEWKSSQQLLGQMDFLDKLKSYDKDNINPAILRKLKVYLSKKEFDPEIVGSKALAAKSLCMWCIAINKYAEIRKIVVPKEQKLKEMQEKLDADMEKLRIKNAELAEIEAKLNNLRKECDDTVEKKQQLEKDIDVTEKRLIRAEKLLELLGEEGIRWEKLNEKLEKSLRTLQGNVYISAAFLSYLGPFNKLVRIQLIERWIQRLKELKVEMGEEEFNLPDILCDPLTIQTWQIAGLPVDQVSTENAILATKGTRKPLMIDPQTQAVV